MPAPKKNPLTGLVKKGVKKTVSKGKAKVEKRLARLNDEVDYQTSGNYQYEYKKKMLRDVVAPVDLPIKVKPRNLKKITRVNVSRNIRKYYGTPEQRTRTGRKTTPMPVKKNTTVKKRSK